MKPFLSVACLAALLSSLPFPSIISAADASKPAGIVQALRRDLKAIPADSQPTAAQKQALAADLARLFRNVNPAPAVTLEYAAEILAEIAARGTFQQADCRAVALELSSVLDGSSRPDKSKLAALKLVLRRVGVDPRTAQRLTDALRALAGSFQYDHDSNLLTVGLDGFTAGAKGYRHASGYASLNHYQAAGYAVAGGGSASTVGSSLGVTLYRVPVGRYTVSVATKDGRTVDLGSFRVRGDGGVVGAFSLDSVDPSDATDDPPADDDGADDPSTPDDGNDADPNLDPGVIYQTAAPGSSIALPPGFGHHYGTVTFGNPPSARPLPAGLSPEDVATVTVTDKQGAQHWTGNLAAPAKPVLSRSAQLHLTAGTPAPTASGSVSFGEESSGDFRLRTFLLSATGLPASATLTLFVDGAAVAPVTTGPTGKLFVKSTTSIFPRPPGGTEIVNPLPEAVDLFAAKSFSVSDSQGNVLLSGALRD